MVAIILAWCDTAVFDSEAKWPPRDVDIAVIGGCMNPPAGNPTEWTGRVKEKFDTLHRRYYS